MSTRGFLVLPKSNRYSTEFSGECFPQIYNKNGPPEPPDPKSGVLPDFLRFLIGNTDFPSLRHEIFNCYLQLITNGRISSSLFVVVHFNVREIAFQLGPCIGSHRKYGKSEIQNKYYVYRYLKNNTGYKRRTYILINISSVGSNLHFPKIDKTQLL